MGSDSAKIFFPLVGASLILTVILLALESTPRAWLFMVAILLAFLLSDVLERVAVSLSKKVPRGWSLFVRLLTVFIAIVVSGLIGVQLEPSIVSFLLSQASQGGLVADLISVAISFILMIYLTAQSEQFKAFRRAFWDRWNPPQD